MKKRRRASAARLHTIADLCIIPIGVGVSLSEFISVAYRIIAKSGLKHELHANGTNVEGEYDLVCATLRRCIEELHALGVPRVTCTIKLGTRVDRVQSMVEKVASVLRRDAKPKQRRAARTRR
ncbi:MAG: MTH1187 family thiamine-binding protein [Planctomycetota bacterium]